MPTIAAALAQSTGLVTLVTFNLPVTYASPLTSHWRLTQTVNNAPVNVAISAVAFMGGIVSLTHAQVYLGVDLRLDYIGGTGVIVDTTPASLALSLGYPVSNGSLVPFAAGAVSIEQWVWDTLGATPVSLPYDTFAHRIRLTETRLRSQYPCMYDSSGVLILTGADLELYNQAVGLMVAGLMTTSGNGGANGSVAQVKRKIGNVEYTYRNSNPKDNAAGWRRQGLDALRGITCVGLGLSGLDSGPLVHGVNPSRDSAGNLIVWRQVVGLDNNKPSLLPDELTETDLRHD